MNSSIKLSSLALATLLTACGGGGGGGNGSEGSQFGQLSLGITDGPVENAEEVVVSFTSVELQGPENTLIEFDAKSMDLLLLQGEDRSLLLDGESLEAGDYQWIRLGIDEAETYIVVDGEQHPLDIPSGAETGLKINRGFTVGAGSSTNFTIDFDLRKSVTLTGNNNYKLRPTLRMVDNLEVTSVNGTVAEALIIDENCNNGDNNDTGNAVYLFAGFDAQVQDLQENDGDPIASASVMFNDESELYEFQIGYIPFGDYTIAFTCDAIDDASDEDNGTGNGVNAEVDFTEGKNITVESDDDELVVIE